MVLFEDYSKDVINKINSLGVKWLEEASSEIESQTKQNTKVDTGKTKGSWEHRVDANKLEAIVGSRYDNALWEELGTGIYALNGDGRKDVPWHYQDDNGNWHSTSGQHPQPFMEKALDDNKDKCLDYIKQSIKGGTK